MVHSLQPASLLAFRQFAPAVRIIAVEPLHAEEKEFSYHELKEKNFLV